MKVATSCEPTFEPEARDFLSQHHGDAALRKACELVRACFPELASIHVRLLEDPDEDNHTWIVLDVRVPASHPREVLQAREARYYDELTRQFPLPYHPFSFSLIVDFVQD